MAVQVSKRLFTVEEFHQMADAGVFGEDDRVELVKGEVVEMTPVGARHASCVDRLAHAAHERLNLESRGIVRVQSPIRLADQSEPQPDLVLLRYRPDFYRDGHPGPNDVLLAVEVADTSAAYDREVKVPLYGRAGIPEVWLIDLVAATIEVYTHPSRQGYDHHVRLASGDRLRCESLPDLEVAVSDLLN